MLATDELVSLFRFVAQGYWHRHLTDGFDHAQSKKDGQSRVSEDGEVIFLYKASDKKQQELITEAFTIRAKRALAN